MGSRYQPEAHQKFTNDLGAHKAKGLFKEAEPGGKP